MNRSMQIVAGIVVAAILVLIWQSAFIVSQTQQALVRQFGDPRRVISSPGLNWKTPFVQDVVYIDKRILGFEAPAEEIITVDQQRLVVDTFARFRITDPLVFYRTSRDLFGLRQRVGAVMNSAVRGVLGNQTPVAIISGERVQIMNLIRDAANVEARGLGIEIVDVRIKRADFPDQISTQIYNRMRTERERVARQNRSEGEAKATQIRAEADRDRTVTLANARRQAEILRGEGDAQRTKILADATSKDPDFYAFLRSLQAYSQTFQPGDTTMVLSPDSEFLHYFSNPPLARPNR